MPLFSKESVLRLSLRPRRLFASIAVSLLLTGSILGQAKDVAGPQSAEKGSHLISGVPLAFEENDGQLPSEFSFLGRTQDYSVAIARDRLKFVLPGGSADSAIDVRFAGSRGGSPVPLSGVAYRSNYFIGADPSQWHQGVANFSRVGVRQIYPGIDTEFYEKSGQLEHDFIVAPGNDAGSIRLDLISTQRATLTGNGDIVIPAKEGELRFRKPSAFQFNADGKRVEVATDYLLTGNTLRFRLGAYDKSRTLVIDPVILFATYLSGSAGSTSAQLATDGSGTLFTVGTTTSVNGFPPLPGSGTPTNSSGAGSSVFIAALTTSQLGSALKWITFLGNAGASTASSIAYSTFQSGTLYVGGQTSAAGFPGAGAVGSFGGAFPSGFGSTTGFVTSLNAGTGGTPNSTYISSSGHSSTITDTTSVTGLAADIGGDVYISGYGKGSGFTLNASLGGFVPTASGLNNAFVLELDSSLDTSTKLVTYLQGTEAADYKATALQVGGLGRIYVAGTVGGVTSPQFPSAKSFSATTPFYTVGNDFSACNSVDTSTRVFLAQILPGNSTTHSTLGFSLFTCGTNGASDSETATGVALGASGIYLVGETGSPDLVASVNYSLPSFAAGTNSELATFSGGLQPTFAGTQDGYVIKVPVSGSPLVAAEPSAFTYLGGAASSTLNAVAIDDANHLLQLAGETNSSRASMPGFGALGLPSGMVPSGDSPRALLYTLDDSAAPFLSTVKSISYLGNTATNGNAFSVLPDGSAGAYVLAQDTPTTTSVSFSSSNAIGVAAAGQPNAYIADIQGTAPVNTTPAGLTFTVPTTSPEVDGVPCSSEVACEIGFNSSSDFSTVLYTWDLNLSAGPADNVVLNFPQQAAFTAAGSPAYTIQADTGSTPLSCVSRQGGNGTTCTFPATLSPGSHTVTLQATTGSGATSLVGSAISFDGNVADAEGEYVDMPQTAVTVANPVSLSFQFTQSQSTIDAANGTGDLGGTGHTTLVTYTATVTNTSQNDSPNTTLKITLPATAAFHIHSLTATLNGAPVASGCQGDGTGCTKVDVPKGETLVYTIVAQYLAANLSATTAGTYNEALSATVQALPFTTNNQPQTQSFNTMVNGYAALTVSVQAPTYPSGQTAFNLNSGPLTYTVTVTNAGPNASGAFSLTNTLPTGFSPTSAVCAPTNAVVSNCDATGGTGLSMSSMNSGGTVVYTINGSFPDNGTAPDAVPQNAPNAMVKDTATLSTPVGTFDPNSLTAVSNSVVVQRSVHLKLSLTTLPTNGATGPLYTQPAYNLGAAISYVYTIQNTGPNIAVAVPLSSAITLVTPGGYTPPTNFVTVTTPTGTLMCTTNYTSCTVSSVPANASSTLTFTVKYPDIAPAANVNIAPPVISAVPTNASTAAYKDSATTLTPTSTPLMPYSNAVDSNPSGTIAGDNSTFSSVNIYRTVHLKLALANSGANATGSSYVQPAYNLGTNVSYAYTIQNSGPNIALNVPLNSLLLPPSGYNPPAGSFTVTTPTMGVNCTSGYTVCGVGAIAPGASNLTFTVAYPDIPPTTYAFPTQDLSAVPSNATTAAYKYTTSEGATTYSNAIDGNPSGTSNGDGTASSTANIYRTSAMTLTPSVTGPGTPCAPNTPTPCLYMANSGNGTGLNDTATYTVAIKNGGPNLATNNVLTIPLPTNFLVTANPSVAFTGIATTGVANQLVCTYQSSQNAVVCQGYVPTGTSTATLTSKFSTSTVPANMSFTTTATPPNTPGSGSETASAINANTSTTLPTVAIDRAAHLVAVKLVGPAPGNISPNGFAVNGVAAVNLDEKVASDANGKNDTVQITQQVGNAGLNDATGVVVTDMLPPYFILTKLPDPSVASCTVSGPTTTDTSGHPMTGAAPATLTCTIQNPVLRGTGTAGDGTAHGTVSGSFTQLVYYGKFEDNGRQPDAIPLTQSSALAPFSTFTAMSNDEVNLGAATDSTSAPVAPIPVQRAAHLHFTLTQYVQPGDAALNPVGGVSGPGIAEAQLGGNGSGEAINPVRYQVKVTNDGPNFATDPVVSTTLPLNPGGSATKFVNVAQGIEPSATQGFPVVPANCATGQACQDAGLIMTGASVLYNIDGNFDVNTLVEGNSGSRVFASAITDATVLDSNTAATAGGDQQTSLPITVVNTPVGANFTLAPFAVNLAQPLNLQLTTVQIAGVTSLVPSAMPALPSGPSPNPPDNGAVKTLYQFPQGGTYYTLGTTAAVPTANANPTTICLGSIPGTFLKPERALLWALDNAPAGTTLNTVPHFTSNGSIGDITTLVLPQGGGSYTVPVPNASYPPPGAQPQPAQVCGVLNGLSSAAAPTTLAVLEPVNFAPFVRTEVTAANSGNSQPGKGVTAAAAVVDLTISAQNNYDYNDQDPCYTGSNGTQRSTCNDNVQLTTFLFGGGNLIGDTQQVHTYFYNDLTANPKPQFNLPAGQPQLYVVLADQLGAQGYKTMGANNQVCDPGTPSTSYTPSTPACQLPTPLPTGVAVPPAQTLLPLPDDTSVEVALLVSNVGFGGSSGLIPLPETPTPEAISRITAGQTAGFVWNWLTERPEVQGNGGTPPVLTLTCDATSPVPAGVQCNIPQTYTYSTGTGNSLLITAPPAIYVVTQSNTAVGALQEGPLSHDLRVVAAIVFPIGAIPLVLLVRRRKALKLSGWLAVALFASLVGLSIGCGSSSFNNMGGTTATATPAGTYEFVVTATGTDANGNAISIKSYPFAVTVTAVQ